MLLLTNALLSLWKTSQLSPTKKETAPRNPEYSSNHEREIEKPNPSSYAAFGKVLLLNKSNAGNTFNDFPLHCCSRTLTVWQKGVFQFLRATFGWRSYSFATLAIAEEGKKSGSILLLRMLAKCFYGMKPIAGNTSIDSLFIEFSHPNCLPEGDLNFSRLLLATAPIVLHILEFNQWVSFDPFHILMTLSFTNQNHVCS